MTTAPAIAPLTDISDWVRGNGLEVVLLLIGTVLLVRFVGWVRLAHAGHDSDHCDEDHADEDVHDQDVHDEDHPDNVDAARDRAPAAVWRSLLRRCDHAAPTTGPGIAVTAACRGTRASHRPRPIADRQTHREAPLHFDTSDGSVEPR